MDILLKYNEGFSEIEVNDVDIAGDDTLYTAVVVSLFTDKRAEFDELPIEYKQGQVDLKGYFGDVLFNESIGSKLWLLKREKQMNVVLVRAKQYAEEALEWLVADGYVENYTVTATNPYMGLLHLNIDLQVPSNQVLSFASSNNYNWNFVYSLDSK